MSVYLEQAPRKEQLRVAQILRDPTYLTTPSNSFLPRNSSPSPTVHPEHPTSVKEPAAASSLKLKREEEQIDLKVLHHLNKDDSRKKQKRFKRTVLAVHRIVTHKLYRTKARSLEAYFRDAWKISRAQVYRFLDCAVILKQLDDFTEQPCRERLCRSLKRVAKNHADLNKLWESVLLKVNDDHEAVTSTIINAVWAELLESGLVTGDPPEREELLDDEPPSATAALAELESQFAQDGELDCRTNSPVQDSHLDSQQSSQAELFSQSERQHTQTSRSYDPAAGGEVVSSNNVVKPAYAEETPVYRPANVVHPLSTGNVYQATSGPSSPSDFAYPPTLESHGLQRKLSDMDGMRTRASTIPDATACMSFFQSLSQNGLALQPLVHGRWVENAIDHWRVVPTLEVGTAGSSSTLYSFATPSPLATPNISAYAQAPALPVVEPSRDSNRLGDKSQPSQGASLLAPPSFSRALEPAGLPPPDPQRTIPTVSSTFDQPFAPPWSRFAPHIYEHQHQPMGSQSLSFPVPAPYNRYSGGSSSLLMNHSGPYPNSSQQQPQQLALAPQLPLLQQHYSQLPHFHPSLEQDRAQSHHQHMSQQMPPISQTVSEQHHQSLYEHLSQCHGSQHHHDQHHQQVEQQNVAPPYASARSQDHSVRYADIPQQGQHHGQSQDHHQQDDQPHIPSHTGPYSRALSPPHRYSPEGHHQPVEQQNVAPPYASARSQEHLDRYPRVNSAMTSAYLTAAAHGRRHNASSASAGDQSASGLWRASPHN